MANALGAAIALGRPEKNAAAGPGAGQVAGVMTMFIPIPGLGLLRRAATATAKAEEPEPVEPDAQAAAPLSVPDRGAGDAAG